MKWNTDNPPALGEDGGRAWVAQAEAHAGQLFIKIVTREFSETWPEIMRISYDHFHRFADITDIEVEEIILFDTAVQAPV